MKTQAAIEDPLFELIADVERFLRAMGFKRIEGNIYGLLVLAREPMTSSEICEALQLSQGAVSQALKGLHQWGAVESRYEKSHGAQVHQATEDTFKTLATVFQKREQSAIGDFKHTAERAMQKCLDAGEDPNSLRMRRLKSTIMTCEGAESVMAFTIALARSGNVKSYARIIRGLPKALNLLLAGAEGTQKAARGLKKKLGAKKRK